MPTLTPDQVQTIKATVPVLQAHGNAITSTFYGNLSRENPDSNNIFNTANQANNHQAAALAGALYAYANHIDDLGVSSPAVERICQKHASLYITPESYDIVGTYLSRAMGEVLGDASTQPIHDAWAAAYWQLANIMIGREKDISSSQGEWKDWRDFKIARKEKESEDITSFYLEPVDGKPSPTFKPGQYISVMTTVPKLEYSQSRQYSLSDAPRSEYYRISVKKDMGSNTDKAGAKHEPGYISNILHEEKNVGDVSQVSHPCGDFFLDEASESPVVLMSAGVGITPMVSILNTLVAKKSQRKVSWIHGTRSTAVQAYGQHIKDVVTKNANVQAIVFNKTPTEKDIKGQDYNHTGRLSIAALDKERDLYIQDKTAQYYICGPSSFMSDMEKGSKDLGVGEERIKLELFGTGGVPSA